MEVSTQSEIANLREVMTVKSSKLERRQSMTGNYSDFSLILSLNERIKHKTK
jgi:hypothetical protein